jgi:hypothetical protein
MPIPRYSPDQDGSMCREKSGKYVPWKTCERIVNAKYRYERSLKLIASIPCMNAVKRGQSDKRCGSCDVCIAWYALNP